MYRPNSLWTWSFIAIVVVQALIALAFEGYVFAKFQTSLVSDGGKSTSQPESRAIPTYLTLFIFGFIYQILLVYDALRLKNTIQVIGLCFFNLALLIYAAVQMDQIKKAIDALSNQSDGSYIKPNSNIWDASQPFLVAVPCVLALGTVLLSIVAWKLYDEFAWTIYKHISADLRMKRRYLTFQIYIALLKFDFFFFLAFTVQFVVMVIRTNDPEFGLTIAAIPITILILILAAYWTRKENTLGMIVIIILYFAALAYFLFKLIRMYEPGTKEIYKPASKSLTTFAVITVILIIITIVNACVCTHNFGKGLKPHITRRKLESEDEKVTMTEMPNYKASGNPPNRMTID
ncbi:MAG: hypothetical protein M4579_007177 [Chaenotheca gracillima]|nr:MAG: hypothetical protein M4579_007177 [Chaenotheca gracillima]